MKDIKIIKNFLNDEEFSTTVDIMNKSSWKFSATSRNTGFTFWNIDLMSHTYYISTIVNKINRITGKTYQVLRVYANGQTYGQDGGFHPDSDSDNCYTLLIYISEIGPHNIDTIGGFTQFKTIDGQVLNINPYQNNAVLFKSKILHRGLAPSRESGMLRITFAFKLLDTSNEVPFIVKYS
jgi:hypothetical protein